MPHGRHSWQTASPLDEDLALLPGALTPRLHEALVRLGTVLPFGRAARLFAHCTRVSVSASTACRLSERAGATDAAVQEAEAVALAQTLPECGAAPRCQFLSADGAILPRGHPRWSAGSGGGEGAGGERKRGRSRCSGCVTSSGARWTNAARYAGQRWRSRLPRQPSVATTDHSRRQRITTARGKLTDTH